MPHRFLDQVRSATKPVGTLITLPCPELVPGLIQCGFDWLWIDMEHAPLSLRAVQDLLQAAGDGVTRFVRIPANDPVWIKQALDLGCDGLIVPMVRTPAEAARAIDAALYPPLGSRSVGITRAHMFGLQFQSYVERANSDALILLQVEHIQAVDEIDAILAAPGISGILAGPYDLSGSMNLPGQTSHAAVRAALDKVKAACAQRSIPIGVFALTPAEAKRFLNEGYDFVALGIDTNFLMRSARESLAQTRGWT